MPKLSRISLVLAFYLIFVPSFIWLLGWIIVKVVSSLAENPQTHLTYFAIGGIYWLVQNAMTEKK